MFTTDDRPGSLVDVLNVFKRSNVNLSHIDKRPSQAVNWDYTFFVDTLGHRKDSKFAEVLGEARAHCKMLTVLSSYPAASEPFKTAGIDKLTTGKDRLIIGRNLAF